MNYRLEPQPLEWIDRSETLQFTLEGKPYKACQGDCISSALLADGRRVLGRSFKYHRPRGVVTLADHDVNALFQSSARPNIRGDVTRVTEGMALSPCNVNGSLESDKDSSIGWLSRFMPVGFYYKAFYQPRRLFPLWEKLIRKKAGLGRVDTSWQVERQAKSYAYADLLVIGAGASGMQAALSAADAGLDVVLVDENPHIGGSLDYQLVNDPSVAPERQRLKSSVTQHPNIRVLTATLACGWYTDHYLPLLTPQGIIKLRSRAVIHAGGVMEQPAVFRNNDLPGVMMASAAQRLISRYAIKPGQRAVVLCANDEGYRATLDLLDAGVEVVAVADLGDLNQRGDSARQVVAKGIKVLQQSGVYEALGRQSLTGVKLAPVSEGQSDLSRLEQFDCDLLLMSVGWAPAAQLIYQAGGKLAYDSGLEQLLPAQLPEGIFVCGRLNGAYTLAQRLADAQAAAAEAVAWLAGQPQPRDLTAFRDRQPHSHPWPIIEHSKGKNFIDFDEDLQLKDLNNAMAEGFDNIELLKRFSTVGMGPSQGKHANMNAIRVLARHHGIPIDAAGSTTARPFFHPVPVSALAGRRFRPERLTALHAQHLQLGAQFMEAGVWLRPEYYGAVAEREACIRNEVLAVRQGLGLIDVSTLGKIEVMGADAERLLDLVYTMKMSSLAIGMTRYGLMVDDSGVIIDDGIVARVSDDRFYVTATTSHADATFKILSKQIQFCGLNVRLVNRTGSLAAMNLAGPHSRRILSALTDIDLDEAAFPYLGMREGQLCGYPVRLIRVGFVGELGYEIHLPQNAAVAVWQALMQAGSAVGIRPFGVEAQRILRLEKGHIIVGQDTDGLTNPFEAAMSWAVPLKSKLWFTGKPSLALLKERCKRRLVGFRLAEGAPNNLVKECHLIIEAGEMVGRVTSVVFSPSLGYVIGLAMLDLPLADQVKTIEIRTDQGTLVSAALCDLPFYDPQGARQRVDIEEVA